MDALKSVKADHAIVAWCFLAEPEESVAAHDVANGPLHGLEAREGTALALEMVHDSG